MIAIERLFSQGFRIFFLSAGIFALLSAGIWTIWLVSGAGFDLHVVPAPEKWHAHEMIFGYASAAVAGFFLTAVPNWTGAKGAPHRFIAVVWGLWLAGRLAFCLPWLPPLALAAIDLAFIPVLAAQMLIQLLARPKLPQLVFIAILALFWCANLLCHLEWLGLTNTLEQGLWGGLLVLCALIVVMGGRVTPGFTRNAMVAAGRESDLPRNPAPLAALSIGSAIGASLCVLLALNPLLGGTLSLLAGSSALTRVALWRSVWTRRQPILWTMHLSYALNALGFILFGLSAFGLGQEIAALHVLGLGGVGGMTIAIMSRASLGHSGRPLIAPALVSLAYILMPVAMLARWVAAVFPAHYESGLMLAGALWCLAFALFLAALWPTWLRARAPRAPAGKPPQ